MHRCMRACCCPRSARGQARAGACTHLDVDKGDGRRAGVYGAVGKAQLVGRPQLVAEEGGRVDDRVARGYARLGRVARRLLRAAAAGQPRRAEPAAAWAETCWGGSKPGRCGGQGITLTSRPPLGFFDSPSFSPVGLSTSTCAACACGTRPQPRHRARPEGS